MGMAQVELFCCPCLGWAFLFHNERSLCKLLSAIMLQLYSPCDGLYNCWHQHLAAVVEMDHKHFMTDSTDIVTVSVGPSIMNLFSTWTYSLTNPSILEHFLMSYPSISMFVSVLHDKLPNVDYYVLIPWGTATWRWLINYLKNIPHAFYFLYDTWELLTCTRIP